MNQLASSSPRSASRHLGLKRLVLAVMLPILPLGMHAQTAITAGSQALLAGWDFDNILGSNISQPSRPRYSDVFGNNSSSSALTAPGAIYFNGTFGSDNWGTVAKNSAPGDIDRDILTRTGTGSTFDLGGQTGGEGAIDFSNANVGVTFDEFSINLHTADGVNSFENLSLLLWGRDVENTAATAAGVTINWFYSVDGGVTKVATGLSSVFDTNVFTLSTVDFSAITALEGLTDVYLIGQVVESNVAARLNLDNIGAYAFAQAPVLLTFWKGGDGVWSLASVPANWNVDGVGAGTGAWSNGNTATFKGTPGTVTVDNTAGVVTVTGLKFEIGGYTVAGTDLTTTTASTPLQVGDGTPAGSAMSATISAKLTGTGGINKTDLGTLILSGANDYAGTTTVSGGTLRINGVQTGTGAVTVATGGTLTGSGTVGGAVTVQDGGTLAGATGTVFTVPGLTLSANSNVNATLGAPGTTGLFQVNGALTLDGTLNVSSGTGFANGLHRLFDFTGALTNNGLAIGTVPGAPADFTVETGTANQINLLVNSSSLFWAGGDGAWATGGAGWNNAATPPVATPYAPNFSIFNGAVGTVTVDAGGVEFQGAQFITDGYVITGGALNTLTAAVRDVRVDSSKTATIASAITGTGGINKLDPGTLVLSGANTYAGGTTVTAGTLRLGPGGSIAGNITNNATFEIGRTDAYTQAGVISGTGAVIQSGTGTTTLTGANTYTGGTTVIAGTLSIGNGGTTGSLTGNITNNATVTFNRSDATTYAGIISGTGTVVKQGTETTSLTGANTYTGATTVSAGTLSIGSGGTTGSVAGNITNNATVAFNRSDAVTYAGIISGTGALAHTGAGTTTLTGANTYAGPTTISAGKLLINGNQSTAAGAVTVASGGTLGGTGTVGGAVTVANGGTLSGTAGSALTLNSLLLNSTSNVDVTLGAPSTSGLFQVNGALTLDGVLNITGGTGYGDGLYRLFNYTGALTNNTMTVGTAPGGASGYTIQTATTGQINVLASNTTAVTAWTGGSGTWNGLSTGTGWGGTNGRWQTGFALFQGTPGTITVSSTTNNPVIITGIQFAVDGYVVAGTTGSVLTTSTANTPFRVGVIGDTTPDSAAMTATISAPIAGTGGVDKTEAGTLILSGTNTFTGGTRITGGTLQVAADTALGNAAGALRLNGGTLRASANLNSARSVTVSATGSAIDTGANNVTLSGVVSGSGTLNKTGSGTLTLTGANNTNTGATTISQGAIMLTASSLGATNVNGGARLAGTGTVRGNLANSGTISPGASPGTMNIAGNYTQSATGNYIVEIASATSHDKIVATGTATLAGSLTITALNGFVPIAGQSFKILEAAGGVSGTFTTVVNPFGQNSAMTRFQPVYNPFDVTLAFMQLPYAGLTGSANQQAIGAAVDVALAAGTIPNLVASLNAIPTETAVRTALTQLSPQRYERWYEQSVYSTGALVRMAESHLGEKRADPAGGLWMELVRRQSKFSEVNESTAAEGTANGIVVGGDIAMGENFKWGLLFGYTDEGLELDAAGSSTSIERFTAASYVRYEATRAFIEAVVGASYTRMDSHRTVDIAGAGLAEGASDGRDTFASLRTGFLMPMGMVRMTPYLGLQYTGFQANELAESGAGDASLVLKEQKADSLASRVGLLTTVPIKGKTMTFTPRLDVAWRFEFRDEMRNLTAELGDTEFTVQTRQPDSSGFIAGLGLDATFGTGTTAYARFSTERTTAADKAFEARAGIDFRF